MGDRKTEPAGNLRGLAADMTAAPGTSTLVNQLAAAPLAGQEHAALSVGDGAKPSDEVRTA
jgi:hypothetical protein